ncbi:hypothetical protein [Portibacter lacus]|uniref:hypothetical protein n=1 Tax=Portibacter lacus TaxID=1099794 RepID=UPI0024E09791|nr:hypothetical protein [Portibacter lacus]
MNEIDFQFTGSLVGSLGVFTNISLTNHKVFILIPNRYFFLLFNLIFYKIIEANAGNEFPVPLGLMDFAFKQF